MLFLLIITLFCCGRDQSFLVTTGNLKPKPSPSLKLDSQVRPFSRVKARHILITHKDAQNAPERLRRGKEEAGFQAEEILRTLKSGDNFEDLAKKHSDGPSATRGGELGVFGRNVMVDKFDEAIFNMKVNEMAIVETIFGFHVIQRQALEEVHLSHIVVQYKGASRSKVKRSKKKARALIEESRGKILNGSSPESVAKKYSDGPFGKHGGEVGWFQKNQLNPSLEEHAFKLKVAEISTIIETSMGFHLLIRNL